MLVKNANYVVSKETKKDEKYEVGHMTHLIS